jgi:hypothetical protein
MLADKQSKRWYMGFSDRQMLKDARAESALKPLLSFFRIYLP